MRAWSILASLVVVFSAPDFVAAALAGADAETEASKEFVRALDDDCIYGDAYQCQSFVTDDFLSPAADAAMLPGYWMIAFSAALQDFNANDELEPEARDLKHYKIGFTQSHEHYIVLFRALLLPQVTDGRVTGLLRTSMGVTTRYYVDRQSFQVARREYLR